MQLVVGMQVHHTEWTDSIHVAGSIKVIAVGGPGRHKNIHTAVQGESWSPWVLESLLFITSLAGSICAWLAVSPAFLAVFVLQEPRQKVKEESSQTTRTG